MERFFSFLLLKEIVFLKGLPIVCPGFVKEKCNRMAYICGDWGAQWINLYLAIFSIESHN